MDTLITYKGWIIAAAFILLFTAEHLRPAVRPKLLHPLWRLIKNLSFGPINSAASLLVILPVSFFATQHALWTRPDFLSGGIGLVLDLVLLDFYLFWWHRAVHEISFFWRFHQVHHFDEHLDTTSAIRFHFGEILFGTVARAVVIVCAAIPFSSIVIFEALVMVCTFFHHANIVLPASIERRLSRVIITPGIHWVHHHALREDTDSNYGTIFSFWDPLFLTKSKTTRFENMKIGVQGRTDTGFFRLLLTPFTRQTQPPSAK